jgi:template-activating factor I
VTDLGAHLDAIKRLQVDLNILDNDCAVEQIKIQQKFDKLKLPLLIKRAESIDEIPDFWLKCILNHPDVEITEEEVKILGYLEDLELQDNMDEFGSHEIKLVFADGNPFFSEKEVFKFVKINADNSTEIEATKITWAPGKKPNPMKFFNFFNSSDSSSFPSHGKDFAEILRNDLWINPYEFYMYKPPLWGTSTPKKEDQTEETSLQETPVRQPRITTESSLID